MKVASTMLITALALSAVQAAPAPPMEERSESTTNAAAPEAAVDARKFPLTKAQGKIVSAEDDGLFVLLFRARLAGGRAGRGCTKA